MLLSSTTLRRRSKQDLLLGICAELLGYSESHNIIVSRKKPGKVLRRHGSREAPGERRAGRGDLEVTVVVQTSEVAETREGSEWA